VNVQRVRDGYSYFIIKRRGCNPFGKHTGEDCDMPAPEAVTGRLTTRSMATDPNGSSCFIVVSGLSHGRGARSNLWHFSHERMYSLTSSDNPFQKTLRMSVS
jgi:hypothetical protein